MLFRREGLNDEEYEQECERALIDMNTSLRRIFTAGRVGRVQTVDAIIWTGAALTIHAIADKIDKEQKEREKS